jgi:hypothetical protein
MFSVATQIARIPPLGAFMLERWVDTVKTTVAISPYLRR